MSLLDTCYICNRPIDKDDKDIMWLKGSYRIHAGCNPRRDDHTMKMRIMVEAFVDVTDTELDDVIQDTVVDYEKLHDLLMTKINGNHGALEGSYLERQLYVYNKDKYLKTESLSCEGCPVDADSKKCKTCKDREILVIDDQQW